MRPLEKSTDPIGAELRQLREHRNYSLADVERLSDGQFKAPVVGSWERGDRRPTAETVRAYVAWYGYSLTITAAGVPVNPGAGFVLVTTAVGATQIECGACGNGAVES